VSNGAKPFSVNTPFPVSTPFRRTSCRTSVGAKRQSNPPASPVGLRRDSFRIAKAERSPSEALRWRPRHHWETTDEKIMTRALASIRPWAESEGRDTSSSGGWATICRGMSMY
jgi:hypothetical protein